MENGSSGGTWIAYGAIVLFLVFVAVFLLRTIMLWSLLLLEPLGHVRDWLGIGRRRGERTGERTGETPADDGR